MNNFRDMSRPVVNILHQPWYILLASGNNTFLVYGVVLLMGMSLSLGVAVKDTTAAMACAIHRPSADCVGVVEALTSMLIVSFLTMGIAHLIVRLMCTFMLENCSIT